MNSDWISESLKTYLNLLSKVNNITGTTFLDTITLKNLYFFARHGYHEEERVKGNKFEVDIIFELSLEQPGMTDDLTQTVDYSKVYEIAESIMHGPSVKLLETLTYKIGNALQVAFPSASALTVRIRKLNPPLNGPCAYSEISRTWQKQS